MQNLGNNMATRADGEEKSAQKAAKQAVEKEKKDKQRNVEDGETHKKKQVGEKLEASAYKVRKKAAKKGKKDKRRKAEDRETHKSKRAGEKLEASANKVQRLQIKTDRQRRVSLGEPGETPKVVHQVENLNATPLAVREARAADEAAELERVAQRAKEALIKHTTAVAELAEKRGGFVATKGGLALVGLVARSMSENPGVGVKNLYNVVCDTLGQTPGRGLAPAAREVRKIMAALKEHKSLEAVMSTTKCFSAAGRRGQIIAKKQAEGPKSSEGSCKLFMGNLSWTIKEEGGEDILRAFFAKSLKGGSQIVDIVLLKDEEGKFLGTGFIEFSSPDAAISALTLHGSECAERPINLHFARARTKKEGQAPAHELSEKPEGCTTVL